MSVAVHIICKYPDDLPAPLNLNIARSIGKRLANLRVGGYNLVI